MPLLAINWPTIIPILITGIVLPLITWFARGFFDKMQTQGIHVSAIGGTGSAPGISFRDDGLAEVVTWSVGLRILNITGHFVVIEKAAICWKFKRSATVPLLKSLADPNAKFFERTEEYDENKVPYQQPIAVAPNGGVAYICINGNLQFYRSGYIKRKRIFPRISVNENEETVLWDEIYGDEAIVTLKIGGKLRQIKVNIWESR